MAHLIFNPFAIPPILAAILNLVLVVWILTQARIERVRLAFILWNLSLALWNASIAVGYMLADPQDAFRWYKTTIPIAIGFISPFFLHFVLELTNPDSRLKYWMITVGYLSGFLFAVTGRYTSMLMSGDIHHYFWGFYPVAGNGQWLFCLTLYMLAGFAFWTLIRSARQATGYQRNQLNYVLTGAAIVFGCGATNFLPLYGVPIYPIGNLTNSLYSLLVAYAILEYGLMDIRVAFRRSAVYGLLTGVLTIVYLSIVMIFKRLFGHYGLEESYVYYTAAVPITILLAPPMKDHLEPWVERASFWKTYSHTEALNDFGQSVLTTLNLTTVSQRVVEKMARLVNASNGAVYLRRPINGSFYRLWHQGHAGPLLLENAHPILLYLEKEQSEWLKEKALWPLPSIKIKESEAPFWLRDWPYTLVLPLFVKKRFFGIIALGQKINGGMYNSEDLHLLRMLSEQSAVALSNAQGVAELEAHHQALKKTHDTAIMGILATEIAHEVAKPLTRIMNEKTRLEATASKTSQKSLKTIQKETQRAAEILDGFAMLSTQQILRRTLTSLTQLIEETLTTLDIKDKDMTIVRHYGKAPAFPINPGQVLQVLTNVIQNAWQAMPHGGVLTLTTAVIEPLPGKPVMELSITDTGMGIPHNSQDNVFKPFFTTKKEQGGRGVGLTISRAMVERHGGTIQIVSPVENNQGTRVIIHLPMNSKEESHETT